MLQRAKSQEIDTQMGDEVEEKFQTRENDLLSKLNTNRPYDKYREAFRLYRDRIPYLLEDYFGFDMRY